MAYNDLPGVKSYSIYPSKTQTGNGDNVEVFRIEHDIPVFTQIPTSSYQFAQMSDDEFNAYKDKLTSFVEAHVAKVRGCFHVVFNALADNLCLD